MIKTSCQINLKLVLNKNEKIKDSIRKQEYTTIHKKIMVKPRSE